MRRLAYRLAFTLTLIGATVLLLKDGLNDSYWSTWDIFQVELIWKDKWVHFGLFLVLSFLMNHSFRNVKRNIAFLLIYGILIEILQGTCTETRTFDILDFVADALGVATGYYLSQPKILNKILKLIN